MMPPSDGNRLLTLISDHDRSKLNLEEVEVSARDRLEESFRPIPYVYFFETGLASIIYKGRGDDKAEIAVVGPEGCSGCSVILGVNTTPQAMTMQIGGRARRCSSEKLMRLIDENPQVRRVLSLYVHTAIIQRDETALAASRGTLLQRLARWLVMCQDRIHQRELPLTHELLSVMLAVRRAGVTTTLSEMYRRGLVQGHRGSIEILDRDGLVELAGPYYGAPNREFDRLLSNMELV